MRNLEIVITKASESKAKRLHEFIFEIGNDSIPSFISMLYRVLFSLSLFLSLPLPTHTMHLVRTCNNTFVAICSALRGGCGPTYEMAWPDSNYSVARVSLIEIFRSWRISILREAYINHKISHGNESENRKINRHLLSTLFSFFYQLNHLWNHLSRRSLE